MFEYTARVHVLNGNSNVKAMATLYINGLIELRSFKVVQGRNGLFVSAPSRKSNKTKDDGSPMYFDEIRFIEERAEGAFSGPEQQRAFNVILEEFHKQVGGGANTSAPQRTENRREAASANAGSAKPSGGRPNLPW